MEITSLSLDDIVPHRIGRSALSACHDRILPRVPGMKQMGKRKLLYNATKGQIIYLSISILPPTPSPSPSPSPSLPRTTRTITHEYAPYMCDKAYVLCETTRENAHERAHDYRDMEARKIAQICALQFLRDLDVQMQKEREIEDKNAKIATDAKIATNATITTNVTIATNTTNVTFMTICDRQLI